MFWNFLDSEWFWEEDSDSFGGGYFEGFWGIFWRSGCVWNAIKRFGGYKEDVGVGCQERPVP